jgi:hypothetical protein
MPRRTTLESILVIVSAVMIALATWALVRVLGVDPMVGTGPDPDAVGAPDVAIAAAVAGLGAWAVHAWLVRRGAAGWWPFVGSTALSVSIIGPSWLADGASAVGLICLHLAVGLVLITGFARLVPGRGRGRTYANGSGTRTTSTSPSPGLSRTRRARIRSTGGIRR